MIYNKVIIGFGFHLDLFIYPIEKEPEYMWCRTELIPENNALREHIHIQALDILEIDERFQVDSRLCYLHYLN